MESHSRRNGHPQAGGCSVGNAVEGDWYSRCSGDSPWSGHEFDTTRASPGALGPGNQGGGGGDAFNLQSLSDVIQELKDMAKKSKDEDKLKKRSHKKKKKTDKKKKKKKRRGSSTSSSRSSRSRSSQSSSRASSSRSSGPLQWKAKAKDRKVKFEEIHAVDREKFKRKGELMAYATKHPGALTAHFLASIYARLLKGRVERSSQLREASVVAWAAQHSGLSEVRDVREVLTLAEAMDSINRKEIERAMDILAQRILAIQQAKRKGGSWDKAEAIELIPGGTSLASSSMLAHKLGWRFRRAQARWSQRNGVSSSGLGYVCMIFSSLEQVFAHSRSAFNYGSWLWDCAQGQRRLRRRVEFSGFFFKAPEHGCSKPHVFPLPPFCKDRRVVEYIWVRIASLALPVVSISYSQH